MSDEIKNTFKNKKLKVWNFKLFLFVFLLFITGASKKEIKFYINKIKYIQKSYNTKDFTYVPEETKKERETVIPEKKYFYNYIKSEKENTKFFDLDKNGNLIYISYNERWKKNEPKVLYVRPRDK